ncbi:MAG: transglutaminase family protein [Planctomycetota bacterium]|nr:MAG: transglutaminase family protein [Planctomycetota bacterium]REK37240.1 MAG: transglutaminase family protein [Planctomycetota bacterium]
MTPIARSRFALVHLTSPWPAVLHDQRTVMPGWVRSSLTALLCLAALDSTLIAEEKASRKEGRDESWQVIYMQGARIGYGHVATETRTDGEGNTIIATDVLNHMVISRFGQKLTITVRQHTEETEDGRLLGFRMVMDNPPLASTTTTGRVEGDVIHVTTKTGEKTTESTTEFDPEVKSPAWQDRQLAENPLGKGDQKSFDMYDPSMNRTVTVTLTGHGVVETELLDGTIVEAEKVTIKNSVVPGLVISNFVDEDGEVLKSEMNLLQTVTYTVDKETALEELGSETLDLAIETLVRVDPIQNAAEATEIVYRIQVAGGDAASHFASGNTQSIEEISDDEIELTVKSIKPESAKGDEAAPDAGYLESTRFLECTDPRVAEHAAQAAGDLEDPVRIAVAMETYVYSEMREKNYETGLATAAEVAESMAGDCTEHSVLLAAMLRAKEIPSRVAVGLVYSPKVSAFAGHMWTEAFLNGEWVPLDATLGRGGIGATHIKVTDSSLDEDAPTPVTAFLPMMHLLGQMTIEVVSAE